MKIVLSTWLKEFYFVIGREISRVKNGLWRKCKLYKEQILERNGLRKTDEIIQKWMQIL
jgi:hypothetical protein